MGGRCNCAGGYEASVYSARDGKKIRKTFASEKAARTWRADAIRLVARGGLRAPTPTTVREAGEALVAGMRSGLIQTRSGDRYKPSAIRSYEAALRLHVYPDLGGLRLVDVTRRAVQRLADELLAAGADPSTIRNALMPLRVVYRRALEDGDVTLNPCSGLRLKAVRGRRERIAAPEEADQLLAALKPAERAIYAVAFYSGLRLGELRALRWSDVDLAVGVIRVERAMDDRGELIDPKTRAGRRVVPLVGLLRDLLLEHKLETWSDGYVLGSAPGQALTPSAVWRRARGAWERANQERAERQQPPLEPIGLHEARHTFASTMIAAGVNARAIASYMGHASIETTFDLYGHLMPGDETEAATLLDAYLERANTAARRAALER